MALRFAVAAYLCAFSAQAYPQRSQAITLPDEEWAEIDQVIRYPHPVKSVERTATRSTLDGRTHVHVQSEPFEVSSDYQHFHFVNCSKNEAGWRCGKVQDGMKVREMRWFVWLKSEIPSEEVVKIGQAISASSKGLSLRTLEKKDGQYRITASANDSFCFSDIIMQRADNGSFLPISPIRSPGRCY